MSKWNWPEAFHVWVGLFRVPSKENSIGQKSFRSMQVLEEILRSRQDCQNFFTCGRDCSEFLHEQAELGLKNSPVHTSAHYNDQAFFFNLNFHANKLCCLFISNLSFFPMECLVSKDFGVKILQLYAGVM